MRGCACDSSAGSRGRRISSGRSDGKPWSTGCPPRRIGSKEEESENEGEEGNSAGENADGEEKKESSEENQDDDKDEKKEGDEGGGDAGGAESGAAGSAPIAPAIGTEDEAAGKRYRVFALIGITAVIAGLAILIIALVVLKHHGTELDEKSSNTSNLTLFEEALSVGDYLEDS